MKKVRLSQQEIRAIKETAREIFGKNVKVYLFGSRVYPEKKGGDIDLYIIPENRENLFEKKIKFLSKLKQKIGEQKIGVIIAENLERAIEKVAIKEGVLL